MLYIFLLGFTSWRDEQAQQGMKLLKKKEEKAEKHLRNLLNKNPKIKGVY